MSIAIVTPRLPPSMDGLGDYCYQLCKHWPNADSPLNFIVLDSAEKSREFWTGADIRQIDRNKQSLLNTLASLEVDTVFLQYVGYGYDPNGAPSWLAEALEEWLQQSSLHRLVTMFHETWSSGKIWQRVFWYMGKQKQCVKDLMLLSNEMGTSCQVNKHSLDLLGTNKTVNIIPLGCSFDVVPTTAKNWKQLLIFGKEYARLRGLETHRHLISKLVESGLVERIVLAGQLDSLDNDTSLRILQGQLPAIEVTTAYNFESNNVPQSVVESGLSLMHTQSTHMLKSTSFHLAAKLGHVCLSEDSGPADEPFLNGQHYLSYLKDTDEILADITDKTKLGSISNQLSQLANTYLSWIDIAKRWEALITNEPQSSQG